MTHPGGSVTKRRRPWRLQVQARSTDQWIEWGQYGSHEKAFAMQLAYVKDGYTSEPESPWQAMRVVHVDDPILGEAPMTPGGSDTRETIACAPPLVCGCTLQRKCATHAEVTWAEINEAQVRDDATSPAFNPSTSGSAARARDAGRLTGDR